MPDLFYIISKWWKQMLALIALAMAVVVVVLLLKPAKYLSVTTSVPGSIYAVDKASVFNKNVEALYPSIGTADDLDLIVGTGQLDTIYLATAESLDLPAHYGVKEQGHAAMRKAAWILKADSRIQKSEYGELKVKTWDRDKNLAAQMANTLTEQLTMIHQDIQNSNNEALLAGLVNTRKRIESAIDSLGSSNGTSSSITQTGLLNQLQEYDRLISEYRLLVENKPAALITVEKARPAERPDKPKWAAVLIAGFVLSLFFALLLALTFERSKRGNK